MAVELQNADLVTLFRLIALNEGACAENESVNAKC